MEVKKTPYYYLSGQRTILMGLAILWVLWFHSKMHIDFFPWRFLNVGVGFIKGIGYGGVDIFLLVSGMGIYQSLEKNNTATYFKNRLKKILPVWYSYMLLHFVLKNILFGIPISVRSVSGYATFTGYWLELPNRGNWYVHAIMLFYMVSPILYSLIKNSRNRKITLLLMILVSVCISVPFMGGNDHLMAISRVPIFILGMFVCVWKDKLVMTRGKWWLCFAVFLVSFVVFGYLYHYHKPELSNYGFSWWPFLLIAPCGSLLVSRLFDRFQKQLRFLSRPLSAFGKASLEILLISDFLFLVVKKVKFTLVSWNFKWLIAIIVSVIIGLLAHSLIEFCKKKCGQFYEAHLKRV